MEKRKSGAIVVAKIGATTCRPPSIGDGNSGCRRCDIDLQGKSIADASIEVLKNAGWTFPGVGSLNNLDFDWLSDGGDRV